MEVDGEAVRALGVAVRGLAADLAALPRRGGDGDGLPQGCASTALTDLHGNFELARTRLAAVLDELGTAAAGAGSAYLTVEAEVTGTLTPMGEG